jgi:hypothetical protein
MPCWFTAGEPEVFLVDLRGGMHRTRVPSLARPSPAPAASSDPGAGFTDPIRDAFLLPSGALWTLTNQEGDRTPLEEGARRGRTVSRTLGGKVDRSVPLSREARAILDANERRLVVLYADGRIGAVEVR